MLVISPQVNSVDTLVMTNFSSPRPPPRDQWLTQQDLDSIIKQLVYNNLDTTKVEGSQKLQHQEDKQHVPNTEMNIETVTCCESSNGAAGKNCTKFKASPNRFGKFDGYDKIMMVDSNLVISMVDNDHGGLFVYNPVSPSRLYGTIKYCGNNDIAIDNTHVNHTINDNHTVTPTGDDKKHGTVSDDQLEQTGFIQFSDDHESNSGQLKLFIGVSMICLMAHYL